MSSFQEFLEACEREDADRASAWLVNASPDELVELFRNHGKPFQRTGSGYSSDSPIRDDTYLQPEQLTNEVLRTLAVHLPEALDDLVAITGLEASDEELLLATLIEQLEEGLPGEERPEELAPHLQETADAMGPFRIYRNQFSLKSLFGLETPLDHRLGALYVDLTARELLRDENSFARRTFRDARTQVGEVVKNSPGLGADVLEEIWQETPQGLKPDVARCVAFNPNLTLSLLRDLIEERGGSILYFLTHGRNIWRNKAHLEEVVEATLEYESDMAARKLLEGPIDPSQIVKLYVLAVEAGTERHREDAREAAAKHSEEVVEQATNEELSQMLAKVPSYARRELVRATGRIPNAQDGSDGRPHG